MRTPLDRLRHALLFEVLALLLVVPLGALAFHMPMQHMGVVALVSATLATLWNMLFNHCFDRVLKQLRGTTAKTPAQRVLHAVLFEIGLLLVLMPFIAWYLGVTLWQALVMDLSFAAFYMLYALGFNWIYDKVFPLPEWREA